LITFSNIAAIIATLVTHKLRPRQKYFQSAIKETESPFTGRVLLRQLNGDAAPAVPRLVHESISVANHIGSKLLINTHLSTPEEVA
jgi:hypothetical protein